MAAGARCERFPTEGFLALAVHPWRFPRWENSGPTRLLSLVAASSRREHPHPEFAARRLSSRGSNGRGGPK